MYVQQQQHSWGICINTRLFILALPDTQSRVFSLYTVYGLRSTVCCVYSYRVKISDFTGWYLIYTESFPFHVAACSLCGLVGAPGNPMLADSVITGKICRTVALQAGPQFSPVQLAWIETSSVSHQAKPSRDSKQETLSHSNCGNALGNIKLKMADDATW